MYNITPDNYYRIKGTDNAFIDGIYITNKPRQKMKLYTTYTYVHPLHDTDTYNISGENWNNILPQNTPALLKENNIPVDEALYIWVPSENKAELFYHLATPSLTFQQQGIKPDVYKDKNYNYVKASDVKYISGPILKPENTSEEAKSDIAIANTQDKQTLQKIIDQEKSIKASKNYIKYYDEANNYNNALKNAKEVNASEKSTSAEVNETTRLLNKAIKNLNEPLVNADNFPIIQTTFQ
ncbi:FIVAR domain-containing protein [Lactobacillus acetotolerans]|jgi:hypothetical protein|uniref:FIVAR domain-containing protein n=1 Tax=Lactobacillus acetotolerans TaxID=1600 RepID=UPI00241DFDFF|nr:FIVAR domain-containing protein [Lactobacillus acetotolerans]